jgi:hypothetical protein
MSNNNNNNNNNKIDLNTLISDIYHICIFIILIQEY